MWTWPAEWEDVLWDVARRHLPEGALRPASIAAAIAERTRRYTSERERLAAPVAKEHQARDLAARLLFFTVADAPKPAIPIAELAGRGLLATPLRVLDVGAGAGAMTLGALAALPDGPVDVTAVDQDRAALTLLAEVLRRLPRPTTARTVVSDVGGVLPTGRFDLVLVGSVLNELGDRAAGLVDRLLREHLADDGALVLVEPALRDTTRALHRLRDAAVAGGATVFAPCTRQGPCPALADEKDWCHEDRPTRPPPRLADLIRLTGLRREGLKLAYLTLRKRATPLVARPGALRVVSHPLDHKGAVERMVCGEAGRSRLRILTREKSANLAVLAEARRGDVLVEDAGVLERILPAGR